MKRPLVGITTAVHVKQKTGERSFISYAPNVTAIERAGGVPVLIPVDVDTSTLREIYERVDAIILPGGGDVDPACYGAEKHPLTERIDATRDAAELTIARWAAEDDCPLLGICRGHQVVNVALEGTLIQDIASQVQTTLKHNYSAQEIPRSHLVHDVHIQTDSCLARFVGTSTAMVNSLHHQAIDRLAPSLQIVAQAEDGLIEAVELPGRRFFLSVQWHPEDLINHHSMLALFKGLVDAAGCH